MRQIARYGWVPDRPDRRDFKFTAPAAVATPLNGCTPDWSVGMPACWDQGPVGSCTGNMFAAQALFLRMKMGGPDIMPSRLFAYWVGREREGTTDSDSGAMIRDVIAGAITEGICPEQLWPYDVSQVTREPARAAFERAQYCEVLDYRRVENTIEEQLVAALMQGPICFGATIYESFESTAVTRTGIVPMPGQDEGMVGGHALWLCQVDLRRRLGKFRNSWGARWGQDGYGWFPLAYLLDGDLCADFWLVTQVS